MITEDFVCMNVKKKQRYKTAVLKQHNSLCSVKSTKGTKIYIIYQNNMLYLDTVCKHDTAVFKAHVSLLIISQGEFEYQQ